MRETVEEGTLSLDDKVSKCDITCALWQLRQVALALLKVEHFIESKCDIACVPRPKAKQVVPSFTVGLQIKGAQKV